MEQFYLTITQNDKYSAVEMEQYVSLTMKEAWDRGQEFMGDGSGKASFEIVYIDTAKSTSEDVTAEAEEFCVSDDDYDNPNQHRLTAFDLGVGRYA